MGATTTRPGRQRGWEADRQAGWQASRATTSPAGHLPKNLPNTLIRDPAKGSARHPSGTLPDRLSVHCQVRYQMLFQLPEGRIPNDGNDGQPLAKRQEHETVRPAVPVQ